MCCTYECQYIMIFHIINYKLIICCSKSLQYLYKETQTKTYLYDSVLSQVLPCSELGQIVHQDLKVTEHTYYHSNLGPVVLTRFYSSVTNSVFCGGELEWSTRDLLESFWYYSLHVIFSQFLSDGCVFYVVSCRNKFMISGLEMFPWDNDLADLRT